MMFARTISFRIKLNIDVLSAVSYFPEKSRKEWLAKKDGLICSQLYLIRALLRRKKIDHVNHVHNF